MMEAVCTSETTVNFFQTTRRNILEHSDIHIPRRENFKRLIALMVEAVSTSETRAISTRLHDATSQKAAIFILASVRTWNVTLPVVLYECEIWLLTLGKNLKNLWVYGTEENIST
jgi:hypothetical protein